MKSNVNVEFIIGDIAETTANFIIHQVNCQGAMNSGVAKSLRKKYPAVYNDYMRKCQTVKTPKELLGQFVATNAYDEIGRVYILSIFGQERYGYDGKQYTDYVALEKALREIVGFYNMDVVAIPDMLGCGRGGGDKKTVYDMIIKVFEDLSYEPVTLKFYKN